MNIYFLSQLIYDRFEGLEGAESMIEEVKKMVNDKSIPRKALERMLKNIVKQF